MADRVVELIINIALWTVQGIAIIYEVKQRSKSESESSNHNRSKRLLSQLSSISPYPRAVLTASSSINFGNDCERLVNIAFQTSQTFPTMMSTCADIDQYLCRELKKHYPDEYFHIIIGENHIFGFSVDDGKHFAEIEQDRYRVLIFSSKQDPNTKLDIHDANSRMVLKWQ
ncbi:unnamed protein product [Rotaria magnacalcarata]|uniref:Uncharacterized protein n=1 Tax=Rotaria magnacalcarata TaxID=392030 RepID=A0A814FX65_9BILA|nr:unnamed protein product [Rotaria magnacalcarata]CAF3794620.1 unnamed protein product [Rotaria magnacalcarata]